MILAAVYLNAILCADASRKDCNAPEFMYTVAEGAPEQYRAQQCKVLEDALNSAQDDKATFYRCDSKRGA